MNYLNVHRLERRGEGQEGELHLHVNAELQKLFKIADGVLFVGPTLERVAVMVKHGVFRLKKHWSVHFKRWTIEIEIEGRRYILFHAGGIPEHSEGCILVGASDLEGAKISGGAPIVTWLESVVLHGTDHVKDGGYIPGWECHICEPAGDALDGVLV
jgi:hypothetical protein